MKARFTLLLCLVALCASPLFSADLVIDYLDGYLDVKDGSDWVEVMIGDVIAEDSTVRLDEDSIAEIIGGPSKITLMKPGVYVISDLLKSSGQQRSVGLASVVGGKIRTILVEQPQKSQTAVMGVRGAKQDEDVTWMSSDTGELIKTGKEHLSLGEIDEAIDVLEEAYDFAEDEEFSEVIFYLSYAYATAGNVRLAIGSLGEAEPDPEAEFFADFVLLKGQLLTEAFAHEDAVSWLQEYSPGLAANPPAQQMAFLLEGINQNSLDEVPKAQQVLRKAIEIDNASEAGKAAASLLEQIQ